MKPTSHSSRVYLPAFMAVCCVAYLLLAFSPMLGLRLRHWIIVTAFLFGAFALLFHYLAKHSASGAIVVKLGFAAFSLFLSLLLSDTLYGVYLNRVMREVSPRTDTIPQAFMRELHGRMLRYPDAGLSCIKPNVAYEADAFGDLVSPTVLMSSTISGQVAELVHIRYAFDEVGYRETTPLNEARVIAVGDSYTYGARVDYQDAWPTRVEDLLGIPVYNAGLFGTNPSEQAEHLRRVLDRRDPSEPVDLVLWGIFEGNDLEGVPEASFAPDTSTIVSGTVFEGVVTILESVRQGSIISRALSKRLYTAPPSATSVANQSPYMADGVRLFNPLFHSDRHGYRLFHVSYIDQALKSQDYVLQHANIPTIESSFTAVRRLAEQYEFKVLVVVIPSAPRIYARHFTGFPQISSQPHFVNYLTELSGRNGFDSIDMTLPMSALSREELLFHRDDSHLNRRGHEVTATQVADHLSSTFSK